VFDFLLDAHPISISSCEKFIVLSGDTAPMVFPITMVPNRDVEVTRHENDDSEIPQNVNFIGDLDVSKFGIRRGLSMKGGSVVTQRDGALSSILTIRGGDTPAIQLTRDGVTSGSETLELISLPPSAKYGTTNIMMSKDRQDIIQVAINATSKLDYTMSAGSDPIMPLLIERDVRAIRHITSVNRTGKVPGALMDQSSNDNM
jgi:hypothetical protein